MQPPAPKSMQVPVGVIVARERIDHPWQEYRWRPLSVLLDAPADPDWREIARGEGFVHYHAATLALELHRSETPGYKENLESGHPEVFVVLREAEPNEHGFTVAVHLATASVHEVQAHGHGGDEIIEPVVMPEPLQEIVAAFVAAHHVEQPFIKRRRDDKRRGAEEHLFGQEPLDVVRARCRRPGHSEDDDA